MTTKKVLWENLPPKKRAQFKGNGVGPEFFPEEVRDFLNGPYFYFYGRDPFLKHDYYYSIGKGPKDRKFADDELAKDLRAALSRFRFPLLLLGWAPFQLASQVSIAAFGSKAFYTGDHYRSIDEVLAEQN